MLVLDDFPPLFIHTSRWCRFLLLALNFDLSFTTCCCHGLVHLGVRCPREHPRLYLRRIPPLAGRLLKYLNAKSICTERSLFIWIPNIIFHPILSLLTFHWLRSQFLWPLHSNSFFLSLTMGCLFLPWLHCLTKVLYINLTWNGGNA